MISFISKTYQPISASLTDEGFIEIVRREPSNMMLTCNPPRPAADRVWKEIYGVVDGKIQLIKTIQGEHKPSEFVEERIIFEEKNGCSCPNIFKGPHGCTSCGDKSYLTKEN